ncbi:MAG: glycosyltransferase family 1 protein [Thermodesulfovibrionales bacterium]
MNIGIMATVNPSVGGGYQYLITMMNSLKSVDTAGHHFFVFYTDPDFPASDYDTGNWHAFRISGEKPLPDIFRKVVKLLFPAYRPAYFRKKYEDLRKCRLDLLIDATTCLVGYYSEIPYIFTVHDLMHKYYKNLPEIRFHDRLLRDIIYSRVATRARVVLVDSQRGKKDVMKFYKIPAERISILSTAPSEEFFDVMSDQDINRILGKFHLPHEYIYYPAQFWHHKNHMALLQAMKTLQIKYNYRMPAVFTGSDKGALADVLNKAEELGLGGMVHYLGYVSEEEKVALYRKARALVMPTFFGPANIPVWEAFASGCPVLTSDVHGISEQVGDAGLLFDPKSPDDIAEKLQTLLMDNQLRENIVRAGYEKIRDLTPERHGRAILDIIHRAMGENCIT